MVTKEEMIEVVQSMDEPIDIPLLKEKMRELWARKEREAREKETEQDDEPEK
jgi:hypothetical protein